MTEFLLFKKGDRVRVVTGDAEGQMGTVEGLDPTSHPREPVQWSVALDVGRTWLFKSDQLEHADD